MTFMELLPRCLRRTFSWNTKKGYLIRVALHFLVPPSRPSNLTYRLQITMDNLLVVEEAQAFDYRVAEAPNEAQTESVVVVLLDQLVQI